MANIVVCVELDGGQPTEASLSAVGDGRRIAEAIGATIYALVVSPAGSLPDEDRLGETIGQAGADKVLLVPGAASGDSGDPLAAWHPPLALVQERFIPRLFLLPVGQTGAALGSFLATRTGGILLPHVRLDVRAGSEAVPASVTARRGEEQAEGPETVDLAAAAGPVVATVDPRQPRAAWGGRPAELAVLDPPKA